jgi:hypothetical protein
MLILPFVLVAQAHPEVGLIVCSGLFVCLVRPARVWMLATGAALVMTGLAAADACLRAASRFGDAESAFVFAVFLFPVGLSLILSALERRRDFVAAFPRGSVKTAVIVLGTATIVAAGVSQSACALAFGLPVCLAPLAIRRKSI